MSSELHKYIETAIEKKQSLFNGEVLNFPNKKEKDISDNLSIKFDINNIDDEPEYYYWGRPDRLSQYDVYGTTYSIGVRYKL